MPLQALNRGGGRWAAAIYICVCACMYISTRGGRRRLLSSRLTEDEGTPSPLQTAETTVPGRAGAPAQPVPPGQGATAGCRRAGAGGRRAVSLPARRPRSAAGVRRSAGSEPRGSRQSPSTPPPRTSRKSRCRGDAPAELPRKGHPPGWGVGTREYGNAPLTLPVPPFPVGASTSDGRSREQALVAAGGWQAGEAPHRRCSVWGPSSSSRCAARGEQPVRLIRAWGKAGQSANDCSLIY